MFVGLADGVQRISADCEYIVRKHSNASGTEPAEPTPDLLQQVLTLSKDAQTAAKNAEQSAKNAAQSAKNAAQSAKNAAKDAADTVKPYKEEAVQAATAAALSEKSAAESKAAAQEAAERATQAGIAASNAAEEAERSAGIATDAAGGSALNAENAHKSALAAQQSANNAAESQSVAAASAESAQRNAEQVAIDAKTASDAKVAAAGSAEAAAGSANAAENSASAAAVSERAAKESADAAAKSAQAALESKTAAETSETNAAASAKKAQDIADSLPEDYTTAVNEIAALKTNKADKTELDTVKQQVKNITPDDSSIGEKPWSSKHIVDMLCPPLEESGNPVVCYPVAGYPLGVKTKWEPTQEGSGTPSPENIRPIKGRNSVAVTRCGENLLNITPFAKIVNKGITFEYVAQGGIKISGTATGLSNSPLFVAPLLHSGKYYGLNQSDINTSIVVTRDGVRYWQNTKRIFDIKTGDILHYWYISVNAGTTIDIIVYPYIVPGTTAPTTYTPYTGQTNTLTLPETVYGGEVDAVSDEGQETWKMLTLNGTEEWRKVNEYCEAAFRDLDIPNSTFDITAAKLSQYADRYIIDNPYANTSADKCAWVYSTLAKPFSNLRIKHEAEQSTLENWKAYIAAQYAAGTPVQVAYKLATPTPFTATGAQPIPALAGANTILTDADSATVTGRADPIKRITDLEAAVASIN
nr:MAG TPA: tail fiber protein [Caudoviricetes sp.]